MRAVKHELQAQLLQSVVAVAFVVPPIGDSHVSSQMPVHLSGIEELSQRCPT